MVLLVVSLLLEAVVDVYLNWLTGTEPTRFIRRQEAFFSLIIQLLATAALVPIAIVVTPSLFYAVVPPLFLLAPINALLALYIAALHAPASVVFRLLTAVMLALGVIYAEKEKKQA